MTARKAKPARRRAASPTAALEQQAITAREHSYAPYSKFRVGAAVAMSGRTFAATNVENASYGLSICAERNAIAAAVAAGARRLEAVVVCTDASPPASPCGACRQVLMEFAADPRQVAVIAINTAGERRQFTLAELLPADFSDKDMA